MPLLPLTFIKLNKANVNINRCDFLLNIEKKQDLMSISLVLGLINLKASLLKCIIVLNMLSHLVI